MGERTRNEGVLDQNFDGRYGLGELQSLVAAEAVKTPKIDTNLVPTRQSFHRLGRRRGTGCPRSRSELRKPLWTGRAAVPRSRGTPKRPQQTGAATPCYAHA